MKVLEDFALLKKALDARGVTVGQHVSQVVTTQSSLQASKCPFLKSHPVLSRVAEQESSARSYARRFPINITKAYGCQIEDAEGNVYLDALAGAGTLNIGHNHPVVIEAARKHIESGAAMQLLDLTSPAKDSFLTELSLLLPESFVAGRHKNCFHEAADGKRVEHGMKVQFCGPAGTDVTECAMKIARICTERSGIIAFSGGYHGHTLGALSCMGNLGVKSVPSIQAVLPGGVHFMPYPYAYRCPFGVGKEGHRLISNYIERFLEDVESGVPKPAAFILEGIQGEGGVIDAPLEFLQRLREACYKHNIVLILDEIQTGLGRTGDVFSFEAAGITPDVICLSKSVGGGMPLGLIAYRGDMESTMWGPGMHAGTFRGNQIALATGAAALRYTRENDLPKEAKRKGELLVAVIRKTVGECASLAEIRGRGLMLGVELVDSTLPPDDIGSFPPGSSIAADVQVRAFMKGMLIERGGRGGAVMRFLCPLVTSDEHITRMGTIFGESLLEAHEAHSQRQ